MKKIKFLVAVFIIVLSFTSCVKGYEYWVDEDGYEYINEDGIIYSTKVEKGWMPYNISEKRLGYIVQNGKPDLKELVIRYEGDEQEMMLMKRARGIGTVETTFYREDYDWQDFDLSGVDSLGISNGDSDDFWYGKYDYFTSDVKAIEKILELHDMGEESIGYSKKDTDVLLFRINLINEDLYKKNIHGLYSYIYFIDGKYFIFCEQYPEWNLFIHEISEDDVKTIAGDLWEEVK